MFSLNETNRFYVYTHSIDMRKGAESLCGIVRNNVSIPSTPYFIKSSLFRTLQSKTTIKFEECLA